MYIKESVIIWAIMWRKKRYYSCKEGSRKTDILRLFLQWFKTTYLEQWEKLQERGRRYKNPEGNS